MFYQLSRWLACVEHSLNHGDRNVRLGPSVPAAQSHLVKATAPLTHGPLPTRRKLLDLLLNELN